MLCPNCNQQNPEEAKFCGNCGSEIPQTHPTFSQPTQPPTPGQIQYAGFGIRLVAYLVDVFVFGLIIILLIILRNFIWIILHLKSGGVGALIDLAEIFIIALSLCLYLIYPISKYGQTLGKKIFKLKVTRLDQQSMNFKNAFIREVVGRFAAGLLFYLGYLWILWDEKKQGWHDKIAGTVVIKETERR